MLFRTSAPLRTGSCRLVLGMYSSKDFPHCPCYHFHSIVPQFVTFDRILSELWRKAAIVGADSDELRNDALRELWVTLHGENLNIG